MARVALCVALLSLSSVPCACLVTVGRARMRAPKAVAHRLRPPLALDDAQYDPSLDQFDLLSLRSFRRDALLQYDATNQSEPLRIALCLLGVLFFLAYPSLLADTPGLAPADPLSTQALSVAGALGSGLLFQRNRVARAARIERISREYALGDLRALYRGVRTIALKEIRGKLRVVIVIGSRAAVGKSLCEAHAYRRRLTAANTAVVPVYTDGESPVDIAAAPIWLWAAADSGAWREYYADLLSRRRLDTTGGEASCSWIGINLKGRSFGSALTPPRWDEILGTALSPAGDEFGEIVEPREDVKAAAKEAATAAATLVATNLLGEERGTGGNKLAGDAAAELAESVLSAQAQFYAALTDGDLKAMQSFWQGSPADSSVGDVVAAGGEIDSWPSQLKEGSRPSGMRATDCDAVVMPDGTAWSTCVERPAAGGTLLATQVWRRADAGEGMQDVEWRLLLHRTIPWDAQGGTAVATLRCDCRGCVALAREINTREVAQRGA